MKTDLDALMQANNVDALWVCGAAMHNPAMVYFTGVAHLTGADLIKVRGQPPVLFHYAMERDEAAKTGLQILPYNRFSDGQASGGGGGVLEKRARGYQAMLAALGITGGCVLLYGLSEVGETYAVLRAIERRMPALVLEADMDETVLAQAMVTKDASEIERVRRMGQVTVQIVERVREFLSGQRARDGVLTHADGRPVTIGDVKRRINLWVAEAGAETPEDTIFAIGADAGVPHSVGASGDLLRLGQTIVFDIFPCEQGGGYFYDFTRTWCLGHAPDEALALYEQVYQVYHAVRAEMRTGTLCEDLMRRTCERFETLGHPTPLSDPRTERGLCHSVGHGLGTHIHARPWLRLNDDYGDRLQPGMLVTYEPGLYYPERGLGVRLEDTFCAAPDGSFQPMVEYPLDLVLPVKQG